MKQPIHFSQQAQEQLKTLGVDALILFGSRALGVARQTSDVDLGVLVQTDRIDPAYRRAVYDELYTIVTDEIRLPITVDIVFLTDAPLELQSHVSRHGIVLFERRPQAFVRFKEQVMRQVADFAPYRALFEQATLARM